MKNNKKASKLKKIIPAVVLLGAGVLITGCSNNLNHPDETKSNIADFQQSITNYKNNVLASSDAHNILNNYRLEISPIDNKDLGNPLFELDENGNPITKNEEPDSQQKQNANVDSSVEKAENNLVDVDEFTLYNLSTDIKENCQRYTTLKNEIVNAINETETLLNKVKNKEIALNSEQKMMLVDQTKQLRALSKQLMRITSQLTYNIDELSNPNVRFMPLKYLVILNNLVDGNEMIENGLHSIEQINQTFYANRLNNMEGKITYRYQKEGQPAVYKEFELKDGKLIEASNGENSQDNNTNDTTEEKSNLSENSAESNLEEEQISNSNEIDFNKNIENGNLVKDSKNSNEQVETSENLSEVQQNNLKSEDNSVTDDNEKTIDNASDQPNEQTNLDQQTNNEQSSVDNQNNMQNSTSEQIDGNNNSNGQFLNSNIDTYYPRYRNIDTFYNTANGFNGYGFNGAYGLNGMGNGYNGYGYNNMMGNNYGVDNPYNTPNVVTYNDVVNTENNNPANNNSAADTNKTANRKKRLIKNVDTYRNADTPTPMARIKNFRTRVKNLIGK